MAADPAPADIVQLADARATARRNRDWAAADALRVRIEDAGWKVIDVGTLYDLERSAPPDVTEGARVRYGSSASVPSRLGEPATGMASVVLVATDWPADLSRTLDALAAWSPPGTHVVVVGNGPSEAQQAALDALEARGRLAEGVPVEVVWTSVRLGFSTALNAGIRRAIAPVVVLLDTSVEPRGDLVTPLRTAFDDPSVAVAGPFGLVSGDLANFREAEDGVRDVDAIEGVAMAFRRDDYAARGPLDEHFAHERYLDAWWSLVLRDQGEEEPGGAPARRAVLVPGLAVHRHEHRDPSGLPADERDRAARRNRYRVLKRFASRRDLLVGGPGEGAGA